MPILFCFLFSLYLGAQDNVYKWVPSKERKVMIGSLAVWAGSGYLVSTGSQLVEEDLLGLNRLNVWAIDRGATFNFSNSAKNVIVQRSK